MKYCKKCLQPNTRPGIKFNKDGVCYACVYQEMKEKEIDWNKREKELTEVVSWAKKASNGAYDCVVGVSGGKDSTLQALYARDELGLRVLLVNHVPDEITDIGEYNLENLVNKGFDMIGLRPNPKIIRKLAKWGFYEKGNIKKALEYPLWSSSYIIASKFDIPLIIQGENAALTLGVAETGQTLDGNAMNVTSLDTFSGGNAEDLLIEDISLDELYMYDFPKEEIKQKNIKAIWLQYYMKNWSQVHNATFSKARGLRVRSKVDLHDLGRYRRHSCLDTNLHIVNQMLKYYKFGFGFATDEACYDIREGRLNREEAKWYVNEFDGGCGEQYIEEFCDYIDITKEEFWRVTDQYVNKDLFYKNEETGEWFPRFEVGVNFGEK